MYLLFRLAHPYITKVVHKWRDKLQQCLIAGNWVSAIPHTSYTWDSRILALPRSGNRIVHVCHTAHPFFSSLTITAKSSNSTKWSGHSKCFCCMTMPGLPPAFRLQKHRYYLASLSYHMSYSPALGLKLCHVWQDQGVTSCRALCKNQCALPVVKKLPEIWQWCGEQVEFVTVW